MSDKQKNRGGRPSKYHEKYVGEAEQLCRDEGYTDEQLAATFEVGTTALYDWKRRYREFAEAIRRGKDAFDSRVVESKLIQRALGYEYEEITKTLAPTKSEDPATGKIVESVKLVVTKIVRKHVIPDVSAISLWLRNRNPKRWRDTQHLVVEEQPEELTPEEVKALLAEQESAGTGLAIE